MEKGSRKREKRVARLTDGWTGQEECSESAEDRQMKRKARGTNEMKTGGGGSFIPECVTLTPATDTASH